MGSNPEFPLNPKDLVDWDKLADHVETLGGLTKVQKAKARDAFLFLKRELGPSFLVDVAPHQHFVFENIINLAPWTREWIVWFADVLRGLKRHYNYSTLIGKIKSQTQSQEALTILGPAHKFSKAGFDIRFDPSVKVDGVDKTPDMKITNNVTSEGLYVEVSSLRPSQILREADHTSQAITDLMFRQHLSYAGRLFKSLSQNHLKEVLTSLREVIAVVKKTGEFREFAYDGVIEIAMASERTRSQLLNWATDRALRVGEFPGPAVTVDEIRRVRAKLDQKKRQLPYSCPSIVIIHKDNPCPYSSDIVTAISQLEEFVYDQPHILACVISSEYIGTPSEKVIRKGEHIFVRRKQAGLMVEEHLLLFNRFCEHEVSWISREQIENSFLLY